MRKREEGRRKGKMRAKNHNNVVIDTLDFCSSNFCIFKITEMCYAIHVCYIKVAQLT